MVLVAIAISWVVLQGPQQGTSSRPEVANQNPYLTEFSLPDGTGPNGLVVDKSGTVFVTSSKSDMLYSFDKGGNLNHYEIKDGGIPYFKPGQNTSMVWTAVRGTDGNIWFSPLGTRTLWSFDPSDGSFHAMESKAGSAFQMKVERSSGNVWFTTLEGDSLGVVEKDPASPSGYKIANFDLGNGTGPAGLYLSGGSVWVTEITSQKVVQYSISEENGTVRGISKVRAMPLDNQTQLSAPTDLVVGNDSVWLTEHGTSFLTEYLLGENKVIRYPTSQNAFHATTLPFWLREAGGGKYLWFNEHEGNKLAFFDVENKTMIEYDIPSRPKDGYLTYPLNIATDPNDGMILWFSEWNTDKLGRIDGHTQVPFSISAGSNVVALSTDATKDTSVSLRVDGTSPYSQNKVFLNASSSMEPAAGFGNVDVRIVPDSLDLSSGHDAKILLRNYSAPPGNYTLGVSVSNGAVTKTIFLDLVVPAG